MDSVPVQYLSLAILIVNILQIFVNIHLYKKAKK